jgi:hypothetical protein
MLIRPDSTPPVVRSSSRAKGWPLKSMIQVPASDWLPG